MHFYQLKQCNTQMDPKHNRLRNDKRQTEAQQQRNNLPFQLTLQNLYLR